jgi:sugar phosphate isomerase/epimerase
MAHHPRISTSSVCTFAWDLDRDLELWRRHGIDYVGVAVPTLEQAGLDTAVRSLRAAGLRICNVIGLGPFRLDAPETWPAARDRVDALIGAAADLDAGALVFTPGAAGRLTWEEAADAFVATYGPVVESAAARGVRIAIENTSWLRFESGFVTTLRDTADLTGRIGAGLCVEVNNCWMERGLIDTISEHADRIAVIQLSDYVIGTGRTPDRAVPGDGDIPLDRIVRLALEAGYEGPFELELMGSRIDEEGLEAATLRGLDALDRLFADLAVPGR